MTSSISLLARPLGQLLVWNEMTFLLLRCCSKIAAFGVEGNDFFVVKMFKDCRFQSYSYYAFIAFLCIRKFYFCSFVIMT